MNRTVAYQRGLEELARQLEAVGYSMVPYEEMTSPVDTILYYETDNNLLLQSISYSVSMGINTANHSPGAFLLNVKDKTFGEISEMIQRRAYSSLF